MVHLAAMMANLLASFFDGLDGNRVLVFGGNDEGDLRQMVQVLLLASFGVVFGVKWQLHSTEGVSIDVKWCYLPSVKFWAVSGLHIQVQPLNLLPVGIGLVLNNKLDICLAPQVESDGKGYLIMDKLDAVNLALLDTIPDLFWELAQLQDTYILQGDYDLKVMRQEFYISRQKAFINHLINQLARHQLLKIACQLEKKNMLGAYSFLEVIESELQAYLSATKGRVEHCLSLIQSASEVQEQGAVDDRDTFLHGVRDLLSIHSNAQAGLSTYVSAPGIVQQISGLHSDLMALQSDLENSLPEDRSRCINELCNLIQSLQQLLFASSTTALPILTPWALMKELDEMEKINAKHSAAVEEVTLEHCKKNEIVKHHSQEIGLQRQVFADFFCNPERLRSQVRELTARVRALQVS
ncbi:hypothetical protein DITRI_Ditri11bG0057500 [Diplodiscus trichospermus]